MISGPDVRDPCNQKNSKGKSMAIVALLAGSTLGAFCGLFAWLFLDTSALSALGLYFSVSLVSGLLPILCASLRGGDAGSDEAVIVRS